MAADAVTALADVASANTAYGTWTTAFAAMTGV